MSAHTTIMKYFLLLWVTGACSFGLIGQADYNVQYFAVNDGLPDHRVHSMLKHSDGFLYLGTEKGVCRFDGYGANALDSQPADSESNAVGGMWELADGSILVRNRTIKGDLDEYHVIDLADGSFTRHAAVNSDDSTDYVVINDSLVHAIVKPKDSALFVDPFGNKLEVTRDDGGNVGFAGILLRSGDTIELTTTFKTIFGYTKVWSEDLSKGVIIATSNGLVVINIPGTPFECFANKPGQEWEYHERCRLITEIGDGRTIISTEDGPIRIIGPQSGEFTPAIRDANGAPVTHLSNVRGGGVTKDGKTAFLTPLIGQTVKLDLTTFVAEKLFDPRNSALHSVLLQDSIIIVAHGGELDYDLTIYNIKSGDRLLMQLNELDQLSYSFRSGFLLPSPSTGLLWYGTYQGLFLIDISKEEIVRGYFSRSQKEKLKGVSFETNFVLTRSNVVVLHERSDGHLWIGLDEGGVDILNIQTGEVKNLNKSDGLSSDIVCGILPDENGYWFSTYHGLSHYDTASGLFRNFYVENGLPHNEFNRFSFCKGDNGYYYFGTMNGAVRFRPDEVLQSGVASTLKLCEVRYFENDGRTSIMERPRGDIVQVTIPSRNRKCYFDFSISSYLNSTGNSYAYQLNGKGELSSEDSWVSTGSNRTVGFEYLPSGTYDLHVRGVDSWGRPTAEMKIGIIVNEHFYKSWWFISLLVVILFLIVYFVYNYRLQQAISVERLRTRLSSDLHDDVGGLLSGVAYQMELLDRTVEEKHRPLVRRVAESSRTAMVRMRDVIWAIDARNSTWGDLKLRVWEYANEQIAPLGIDFKITEKGLQPDLELTAELRHGLILIFKEFVTNSIKHSGASQIEMEVSRSRGELSVTLKDNGRGTELSRISTGQGLDNMRMRVEKMGGTITIDGNQGFSVEIKLRSK